MRYTNCRQTSIPETVMPDMCLVVTLSNGDVMYAALKGFHHSSEAFSGILYSQNGNEIVDSQISVSKQEDDGNAAKVASVIIVYPEAEDQTALELECNLTTGVCKEEHNPTDWGTTQVDEVLQDPNSLQSDIPFDRQNVPLPVEGFRLRVKVFYDTKFAKRFGNNSEKINAAIDTTLVHANSYFKFRSLTTKIEIDTTNLPYQALSRSRPATHANLDNIWLKKKAKKWTKEAADVVLVFSYKSKKEYRKNAKAGKENIAGIANIKAVCAKTRKKRLVIVNYSVNAIKAAPIVAHELGHFLGMKHDFEERSKSNKNSSKGEPCTKIDGIMDYKSKNRFWSPCSVEDFTNWYNEVLSKQGKWCLQPLTDSTT